jgi:hypothetical protein
MFCDSHYISRFAAFFIDARAKRSFVESFQSFVFDPTPTAYMHKFDGRDAAEPHLSSTSLKFEGTQSAIR